MSIISAPARRKKRGQRRPRWWVRVGRMALLFMVVMMVFGLSGCLERFAFAPSGGTLAPPPGVAEVYFEATDGTRLHGWFAAAESQNIQTDAKDSTQQPTVLVIHGNAGNVSNHYDFVEFLPRQGFNVFIFDYRSYGLSEPGKLRRDFVMKDVEGALEYLLHRDDIDPGQILLYAQSLGGTFGSKLMADHQEIKAVVLVSAFTSWQDVAVNVLGASGNPGSFARGVSGILMRSGLDPITELPKVTRRPVMIVHGKEDRVVPFAHGERLYQALQDAGNENSEFHPVEDGDHNSLRWLDGSLDAVIVDFYHRSLAN